MRKNFKIVAPLVLASFFFFINHAGAVIDYGSGSLQSPYAATTTNKVSDVINQVVKGELGATSTTDVNGIVEGTKGVFSRLNDWLATHAGIDFFGILKAIGHGLLSVMSFVFDFIRKSV